MSYKKKRQARIEALINESINRVVAGISKQVVAEDTSSGSPGLNITPDDLAKMDVNKVSSLAQKTNVNVTDTMKEDNTSADLIDVGEVYKEDGKFVISKFVGAEIGDRVRFTDEYDQPYTATVAAELDDETYSLADIKHEGKGEKAPQDSKETKAVANSPQEEAVYNVTNWAHQLNLNIGEGEEGMNQTIKFGYYDESNKQYIAILVYPTGIIKMSGHVVQDFNDFKNIVDFHKDL